MANGYLIGLDYCFAAFAFPFWENGNQPEHNRKVHDFAENLWNKRNEDKYAGLSLESVD